MRGSALSDTEPAGQYVSPLHSGTHVLRQYRSCFSGFSGRSIRSGCWGRSGRSGRDISSVRSGFCMRPLCSSSPPLRNSLSGFCEPVSVARASARSSWLTRLASLTTGPNLNPNSFAIAPQPLPSARRSPTRASDSVIVGKVVEFTFVSSCATARRIPISPQPYFVVRRFSTTWDSTLNCVASASVRDTVERPVLSVSRDCCAVRKLASSCVETVCASTAWPIEAHTPRIRMLAPWCGSFQSSLISIEIVK